MKKRIRKSAEDRKNQILDFGIDLAVKIGYQSVTRDLIAKRAKISAALITYYFKNINYLKKLILKTAIEKHNLSILAQALSLDDPAVKKIDKFLKNKIIEFLNKE